jgi:hypothetical protein
MAHRHLDGPITPDPELLRAALKEAVRTWRERANAKVTNNPFSTVTASHQDWQEYARLRREALRLEAMAVRADDMAATLPER